MELQIHRVSLHEHYLERETPLHKLDTRVKTVSILILLFLIASTSYVPAVLFLTTFLMLAWLRVSLKKLIFPSTVATVVFLMVLLTHGGGQVIWKGWVLSVTTESLHLSVLLILRVLTSLNLLYLYISTTRLDDVLAAMRWMKVPRVIVDLSYLMLRYTGLLSEEAERMYFAAKARHAFSPPYFKRISNFGMLAGSLLLRALDRSERAYLGLLSRGYSGRINFRSHENVTPKNWLFLAATLLLSLLSLYMERVIL